jgi:hypothetical protein
MSLLRQPASSGSPPLRGDALRSLRLLVELEHLDTSGVRNSDEPTHKKGDCPSGTVPFLVCMARPERLLGAMPLAPSGSPPLCVDALRSLRLLVELPTAWFAALTIFHNRLLLLTY